MEMMQGIGVNIRRLRPHVVIEKVISAMEGLGYAAPEEPRTWSLGELAAAYGFDSFVDFLTFLDDTDTLISLSGEGSEYLVYPPLFPWQMRDNEPQSEDAVTELLVSVLKQVTNLTEAELRNCVEPVIGEVYLD